MLQAGKEQSIDAMNLIILLAAVLHAGGVVGAGDEAALFVERALAAGAEELDIADAGLQALFHQAVQNLAADALTLVGGQDDHVVDHGVQHQVGDHAPEADQLLAIVGCQHIPGMLQHVGKLLRGSFIVSVPTGGLE